jgi:hypothetical protein
VLPDEEQENRFQSWKFYILRNIGFADEKVLRYIWGLYDYLITEIKNLTTNKNGKT